MIGGGESAHPSHRGFRINLSMSSCSKARMALAGPFYLDVSTSNGL